VTSFLEIAQLANGDVVLREVREDTDEAVEEAVGSPVVATVAEPGATIALPDAAPDSTAIEESPAEPLLRIRFSRAVQDMLGGELVDVAEAMIDAAADFLDGESRSLEDGAESGEPPIVH
jgi:hypothetical protein